MSTPIRWYYKYNSLKKALKLLSSHSNVIVDSNRSSGKMIAEGISELGFEKIQRMCDGGKGSQQQRQPNC